jgi:uncharacterized protein YceK
MKKILFIALVALVLLSSCVSVRQTCPSTDPQFFYKQVGAKPYYYKR